MIRASPARLGGPADWMADGSRATRHLRGPTEPMPTPEPDDAARKLRAGLILRLDVYFDPECRRAHGLHHEPVSAVLRDCEEPSEAVGIPGFLD